MVLIRRIDKEKDIDAAANVLRKANVTVATDLGFTRENAPTNPAFIDAGKLKEQITRDRMFFVLEKAEKIIGTVALERSKEEEGVFYIERLAVLPEYRHNGYGKLLMDYIMDRAMEKRGNKVSVGIINENTILKNWYLSLGFTETGIKKFEHLPFTVCFLEKEL
jgi:N-acetylglutamate synthase-like GNAT family acetyltransferase